MVHCRSCDQFVDRVYKTSEYSTFTIFEPKERLVFRLPYFPDRISHHAIMNMLEDIFVRTFTADTYSCIKGRGIHGASFALRRGLKNKEETEFCLKLDITKFYPSVDHDILKTLLRRKIKDKDLLWLLDEIINSAPGLPIGNYLSQYLANFYLTYFDHYLKEELKIKRYYRYADDIVILGSNKPELHKTLENIRAYLQDRLNLKVKDNYQVFPVKSRGIDFVGYVHYHTHVKLRKSIKKECFKKMRTNPNPKTWASYNGWFKHGDCKNLTRKILYDTNKKVQ